MNNEAFLKRLLETFAQEAKEHIDNLSAGLLNLKNSSDADLSKGLVETLFREAHSFKGASRSVNISEIEELCKAMENVFSSYKESGEKIPDHLIEKMLDINDMLSDLSTADEDKRRDLKPKVQELINALKVDYKASGTLEQKASQKVPQTTPLKSSEPLETQEPLKETKKREVKQEETIRIDVKKLDAIMHRSEEMLFAKMVSRHYLDKLSTISDEISELIKNPQNFEYEGILKKLGETQTLINRSIKQAKGDSKEIELMVNHLINDMKEALMLPFSAIFATLPKIVHDMAKSVGKDVSLHMVGGETEIDKRITQQMHDPIIHLLRNSIDHGIQSKGEITLTLTQKSASKVELSIADDGSGIDSEKIRQSSVKKGIVTKAEVDALDEESSLNLVFQSGVSTAKIVTDLSGRGLGLAIVKEKSEQLGGQVHVANNKDAGCTFTITLPLSMSTFKGVITSLADDKFIFASEHVVRVMEIQKRNIKNIENKEMILVENLVVPFYHLSDILRIHFVKGESENISVVVIKFMDEMLAVGVSAVDYEDEVMVKSLGKQLEKVQNISGVSLLASDIPALILNIPDVFKTIQTVSLKTIEPITEVSKPKPRILVVDDSPTTLALLQNVLEMVGYDVVTAVDGMEAFDILKKEGFDLVISDVDMPRMNGFELTESIRKDEDISKLPVILVTALESEQDKERGMDAGANAYLTKSTFDQNNLINNIQSLID